MAIKMPLALFGGEGDLRRGHAKGLEPRDLPCPLPTLQPIPQATCQRPFTCPFEETGARQEAIAWAGEGRRVWQKIPDSGVAVPQFLVGRAAMERHQLSQFVRVIDAHIPQAQAVRRDDVVGTEPVAEAPGEPG